jgi:hypothetical protein
MHSRKVLWAVQSSEAPSAAAAVQPSVPPQVQSWEATGGTGMAIITGVTEVAGSERQMADPTRYHIDIAADVATVRVAQALRFPC